MITSSANPRVKQIVQWQTKAKERKKDDIFLAEGVKMYEEAPEASVSEVYVIEEALEKMQQDSVLRRKLERTGYETVSPEVFQKMSDTQTPQGVLCLVKQYHYKLEELLEKEADQLNQKVDQLARFELVIRFSAERIKQGT